MGEDYSGYASLGVGFELLRWRRSGNTIGVVASTAERMATSGDQVSGTRRAVVDWASDAGSVPGLADRRHAVPVP
jgi:hypothetical protein